MQGFAPAQQPVREECAGELAAVAPPTVDMVVPWPVREWAPTVTATEAIAMRAALERGNVLHFPALDFPLNTRERRFQIGRASCRERV